MNRKGWYILSLAITLILVVGCSKKDAQNHSMHEEVNDLQPILVELLVSPSDISKGDPVTFEAKVTYNGKNVDDAKEVMFEYWKEGDDDAKHKKVTVTSEGQGLYKLGETFLESGTYHVISHVTALDQHSMPMTEFKVK